MTRDSQGAREDARKNGCTEQATVLELLKPVKSRASPPPNWPGSEPYLHRYLPFLHLAPLEKGRRSKMQPTSFTRPAAQSSPAQRWIRHSTFHVEFPLRIASSGGPGLARTEGKRSPSSVVWIPPSLIEADRERASGRVVPERNMEQEQSSIILPAPSQSLSERAAVPL